MTDVLSQGPLATPIRLLLAHGAGAPMTSPFMEKIAGLLIERGLGVSRFEFAYMAGRRKDGKRRPPPKAERLVDEYKAAVTAVMQSARVFMSSLPSREKQSNGDQIRASDRNARRAAAKTRLP